ncbi:hypothetical protein NDU88_003643 [Pleurodeles waltl]|uniref:Uncharacterized protein n=1 Tax=Pleurodeles waltl TaxID=8319 RepID=A0AAV7SGI6_PLEWA|nr:hypothetical protein NDU88_003643 [Pleurodeles waltl]
MRQRWRSCYGLGGLEDRASSKTHRIDEGSGCANGHIGDEYRIVAGPVDLRACTCSAALEKTLALGD